jgi:hypothetical protein
MLRFYAFVIAILALAAGAAAQQPPREPQTLDELIDFVLRPSQAEEEAADEEDVWDWATEPEPSALESEIGPPLAGPTGDEAIGPPLAGPDDPLDAAERLELEEETLPFAAEGVRFGPFVIRPSIEIGVTATSNVTGEEDGEGAVGAVVAPALNALAEDDRYKVEIDLSGEGIFYDESDFNTRDANARIAGRYDLTSRTSLVGEAGYTRFDEDFDDPDTPAAASERPAVHTFDATLGVEQRFGRFSVTPSAFVERSVHEDVPLAGGGVASRREQDNTEYGGRVRAAYASDAVLAPFTEVAAGRRDYDQEVDDSGFERSSLWGELRGGLVIDRGEKLSGEVAVGFRREELEDGRLPEINAVLVDASILWSPRRLTEVRVDLVTDVLTTSVPDESGSVLYSGLFTVARQVTPRVRLAAGGGIDYEYSVGGDWHDVTFIRLAEASYAFNRFASLQARYVFERTESSDTGGDTDSHKVSVRLRLQR